MIRLRKAMSGLDRTTVIIVVAVLVLGLAYAALAGYVSRFYDNGSPFPSVSNRGAAGLSVWYGYLEALGLRPRQLTGFDELPKGATIVAVSPFASAPAPGERERLAEWVRDGGRLVLVGGQAAALATPPPPWRPSEADATSTAEPQLPGPLTGGIERIEAGEARFVDPSSAWVPMIGDVSGAVILTRSYGRGEVVCVADPRPVSNDGISEADDADLAVLLAASADRPIYFDEYHQGLVERQSAWDRLGASARWAAWLLLLGALALVVAIGRRIGPPIEVRSIPAARGGAYITQLAALYRKAGARAEALESLEDGLARALARRWGTRATGLERHAGSRSALEASAGLRARGHITKDEFLAAAQRLRRARQEVEGMRHG